MSHRRKHVQALANEREVSLDDDDVVCRVTAARGSNLVEVVRGDDRAPKAPTPTLVRVPMKFKSVAFFRAGTFVVARFLDDDEVEGSGERCKVTGELTRVLYAEQVKEMRKRGDGTWPEAFQEVGEPELGGEGEGRARFEIWCARWTRRRRRRRARRRRRRLEAKARTGARRATTIPTVIRPYLRS